MKMHVLIGHPFMQVRHLSERLLTASSKRMLRMQRECSWIGHGSKSQKTINLILSSTDLVYMIRAFGDGDWIITAAHARWELIFWQDRRSAPAASRVFFLRRRQHVIAATQQ
jgi:hypothetical protein